MNQDERTQYLLTKRAAGHLVLEEMGAVRQAIEQIRALVADAVIPLAQAVNAMGSNVDAETHNNAVRSLQFADMVEQLGAYCDDELDNVESLARELNQLVNELMHAGGEEGPVRLASFINELDGRLVALRNRLADHGHKSVVQSNMDEGDIELF